MGTDDQINTLSRLFRVSHETISSLKKYEKLLIKANNSLNLIGKSTLNQIWNRHFIDSFQVIDFIDKSDNSIIDMGSGAGFPGMVLAIAAKDKNIPIKITLVEKSKKKANFLNDIKNELNLNVHVICKNILNDNEKLSSQVFVARAFKPFEVILELIHNKIENFEKFFVFLGKTGLGKTTTVINLATALSFKNIKVLVIDLDPQGNATTGLGLLNTNNNKTIYDVLNGNSNFEDVIQETKIENLKLVSSNVDLSGLEVETANENRRAFLLKDKIENYINSSSNDLSYIFIDCPPSLSLLTVMSLVVAKSIIVPLQTEFFALEGLSQLMKTIDRIKVKLNPDLEIRGVLLSMFDKRNKLSMQVDIEARKFFSEKVYKTVIPRNVRLSEAPSHGIPVLIYDKFCSGSKSYLSFTEEFLKQENVMESAA